MAQSENGDWFCDNQFWIDVAGLIFDERRWAEVPNDIDSVLALTGITTSVPTLDACCGPGRHALELARRGFPVVGVDVTKPYIDAAAESACAMNLSIEFIEADMRSWRRPGSFDLALNLYTSFGYCESIEDDERILRSICGSLRPGGQLVLEMVGKETAAMRFTRGERFEQQGRLIITEYEVLGAWEAIRNNWHIIDGAKRVDRSWIHRLYSARELRESMLRAGFQAVRIYGSYAGTPYDQNAETLLAVAVKG